MKVSIIGHGFVGKALENALNENTETLIIDPIYENKISDITLFNPDYIFICVPTPMADDGNQDLSILDTVIQEIKVLDLNSKIILKSTVLPNNIAIIEESIPDIIYNPEFLTEKNSFEDFINGDLIVIGGKKKDFEKITAFYKNHTKCLTTNFILTDLIAASLIKYTINSYLASKVMFFNELHNLFKKSGTDEKWDNFIDAVSSDPRIGRSHMKVPGPDGRYGFGGACFPKDTQALYNYSISEETPLKILKKVIELNNNIRGSYESETDRENEQNINF